MSNQKRRIKAIVFKAPGRAAIETFELPACGPHQVIAETIYTFVSPGTELRVFFGTLESKAKFPLIPGYSWVGRIIEIGSDVKGWQEGELVTGRNPCQIPNITSMWGGQASHHRCEITGGDSVLKLPAGADPWDYVIAEVAAISWRGVSAAYPASGETAVVIGQGLIGTFCAKWLLYHGAKVIVTDLENSRLEQAKQWGAVAAINAGNQTIREEILSFCGQGADIVVEASGSSTGAKLAAVLLRQPEPRSMNTDYQIESLHSNAHVWPRLVFQATYTNTVEIIPGTLPQTEGAVVLVPADRTVNDRLMVIERIRKGDLLTGDIIAQAVPVENAQQAYTDLRDTPGRFNALAYKW
jgi:2-desacetyl-2-hydroxyethyl bacteriochlorophyllide A dehydrogenase